MKIELMRIPVREVIDGYVNNDEEGIVGYGGRLNIRPKYQREFVYDDKKRNMVIDTIKKDYPLNVMYWVKSGEDSYEVLDGQQRTLSICKYIDSEFTVDEKFFHNLTDDKKEEILEYPLMIYICEGTDSEKLEWFEIINIAGLELTKQEIRNAMYSGEWLTDAKRHFSKTGCPASGLAGDYLKGYLNRQAYLETAIKWIASRENKSIREYMAEHQHDSHASALWLYFQRVINWVETIFPRYRKQMKGIEWGLYYNQYGEDEYNPVELERRIVELLRDEDVTRHPGIYEYLIDGNEKHLSIRSFPPAIKQRVYEKQEGICVHCGELFDISEMEPDHITPWSQGGKTSEANCQILCRTCNRTKSDT